VKNSGAPKVLTPSPYSDLSHPYSSIYNVGGTTGGAGSVKVRDDKQTHTPAMIYFVIRCSWLYVAGTYLYKQHNINLCYIRAGVCGTYNVYARVRWRFVPRQVWTLLASLFSSVPSKLRRRHRSAATI